MILLIQIALHHTLGLSKMEQLTTVFPNPSPTIKSIAEPLGTSVPALNPFRLSSLKVLHFLQDQV